MKPVKSHKDVAKNIHASLFGLDQEIRSNLGSYGMKSLDVY